MCSCSTLKVLRGVIVCWTTMSSDGASIYNTALKFPSLCLMLCCTFLPPDGAGIITNVLKFVSLGVHPPPDHLLHGVWSLGNPLPHSGLTQL